MHVQTRGVAPLAGRPRVSHTRATVPRAPLTGSRPRAFSQGEPSTSARESRWRVALAASFVTTTSALAQLWMPLAATARTAAETPASAGASTAETRAVPPVSAPRFHHLERLSSPLDASPASGPGERKAPETPDIDTRDVDKKGDAPRIAAATAPAPPRRKANAFVREAADAVGPCVVRIDVDFDAAGPFSHPRGSAATDEALAREREAFAAAAARRGARRNAAARRDAADAAAFPSRREGKRHGQGCGLVIDSENGLIVTNAHVIKKRGVVRVTLADGRSVPGDVVGVDALTDIALVRCRVAAPFDDAKTSAPGTLLPFALPAAPPLGDSAALEVGDWVIALGNPFGLDNTITLGIVSHPRRTSSELGVSDRRVDFLQTDCAINPGNSGGPLVNEFGEVVAITAAVRADAEGIGFAIPVNEVRRVVGLLATGRPVAHAHVGVRMVDAKRGLPNAGAEIVEVFPGSPAFFAGARAGDVCVAMEGESLADAAQVRAKVEALLPGQPLTLTVARGGKTLHLEMRAADRSALHFKKTRDADGEDDAAGVVRGGASRARVGDETSDETSDETRGSEAGERDVGTEAGSDA